MEGVYKRRNQKVGVRYLDLTYIFGPDTQVFPGDPKIVFKKVFDSPQVTEISFGTHSGTHMDAPAHFFSNGKKLADFGIESFVGRGVLLDARGKSIVGKEILEGREIFKGDIVLICTGWQEKYKSVGYFKDYPVVSEELAKELSGIGIKMLGFDSPGPDIEPFLVHKILLEKEIVILENLCNLEELLTVSAFEVIALPLKLEADGGPARVIAKIYE